VQRLIKLRQLAVVVAVSVVMIAGPVKANQPVQAPLPEKSDSNIGYETVAAALTGLRSRPGVVFTTENGWLIATEEAVYTIWSFAPQSYPSYPAVVKRQVIPKGTGSLIEMSVLCEASKSACDDLVRTFAQMNGLPLPQ
jgi:hypothetical protein